ncbi:hypothetical protein KP509_13G008300 [Ceratopteris richardii]|uniref:ADF-H domain-containing protein n=1 Tax=Ceratopteris richardii TaxID=49495 RepID=A0A8T2TCY1_CERRI|nr:hypothetical protein KP509_13G008300 [Ceratopteris richardii]
MQGKKDCGIYQRMGALHRVEEIRLLATKQLMETKMKRKENSSFSLYKIDDKLNKIVVEIGGPDESFDNFTSSFPGKDCKYAIYDYDYVTKDNCQKSRIFFVAWTPDVSRVRTRMLYASSKDHFKRELYLTHEIQATDASAIENEHFKEQANRF